MEMGSMSSEASLALRSHLNRVRVFMSSRTRHTNDVRAINVGKERLGVARVDDEQQLTVSMLLIHLLKDIGDVPSGDYLVPT
jgi:hypothetical protein